MKKEAIFKKGIKELIEQGSLEDITVVYLCKYVGSNRQTFYYHFRDIYDLLTALMLREQIPYSKKEINYENIYDAINSYINSNFTFLNKVKKSYAGDLIDNFFNSFIFEKLQLYFKTQNTLKIKHNATVLSLERCLSNILASEFSFFIATNKKEGAQKFKRRLKNIWNYFMNVYPKEVEQLSD